MKARLIEHTARDVRIVREDGEEVRFTDRERAVRYLTGWEMVGLRYQTKGYRS